LDAGNEFKHGGIGLEFKFKVIKEQPAKSLNRSSLIQRYWRVFRYMVQPCNVDLPFSLTSYLIT